MKYLGTCNMVFASCEISAKVKSTEIWSDGQVLISLQELKRPTPPNAIYDNSEYVSIAFALPKGVKPPALGSNVKIVLEVTSNGTD